MILKKQNTDKRVIAPEDRAVIIDRRIKALENGTLMTPNVWKIQKIYREVSKHYPGCIIAGGSIVDCVYNKTFYDVDIFVYGASIDPIKYAPRPARNGLLTVERLIVDHESIDVVIINQPFEKHMKHFDMNLKRCYYDGSFHFTEESKKDFLENKLRIGYLSNDHAYFRYIRTLEKYHLEADQNTIWNLNNYLSWKIKNDMTVYISKKYQKDYKKYKPLKNISEKHAKNVHAVILKKMNGCGKKEEMMYFIGQFTRQLNDLQKEVDVLKKH